jgi:hypothetical protein
VFTQGARCPCTGGWPSHGIQTGVGGVREQSAGAIQHVPGPGGPHPCEGIGLRCAHEAPDTPQSAAVVHAVGASVHCPGVLAGVPVCWRTQSFQYVSPSQPQTGTAELSHRIGRGWQIPAGAAQFTF